MLCCCSAGKTLAGTSAPTKPAPIPAKQVSRSCCAHHAPAESDQTPSQKSEHKPEQAPGKCPCKESATQPQLTQTELEQNDLSAFLRALDTPAPFAVIAVSEGATEANAHNEHRLSDVLSPADELLYAQHKLRC
jgi:hypothetical protein